MPSDYYDPRIFPAPPPPPPPLRPRNLWALPDDATTDSDEPAFPQARRRARVRRLREQQQQLRLQALGQILPKSQLPPHHGRTWSNPRRLPTGDRGGMMMHPAVANAHRLICPQG